MIKLRVIIIPLVAVVHGRGKLDKYCICSQILEHLINVCDLYDRFLNRIKNMQLLLRKTKNITNVFLPKKKRNAYNACAFDLEN